VAAPLIEQPLLDACHPTPGAGLDRR
jgi:hypothetical protein